MNEFNGIVNDFDLAATSVYIPNTFFKHVLKTHYFFAPRIRQQSSFEHFFFRSFGKYILNSIVMEIIITMALNLFYNNLSHRISFLTAKCFFFNYFLSNE